MNREFVTFCEMQLLTNDYDAHLPFLEHLARDLPLEEALWMGLLYMAFYTEGSMWVAFQDPEVRVRKKMPPLDLPITVQRRNLYGGKIRKHLDGLMAVPSLTEWVGAAEDWGQLLAVVGSVWGNGRWASYTTSELLAFMAKLPIEPSTFEILGSSGPRQGLRALGLDESEYGAKMALGWLEDSGVRVGKMSVLESLLCDWAGMCKGTFYAGRNIDRQQGRILDVERRLGRRLGVLWEARRAVYPKWSLGELGGWEGIDRQRLRAYRERRVLLRTDEARPCTRNGGLLSHV